MASQVEQPTVGPEPNSQAARRRPRWLAAMVRFLKKFKGFRKLARSSSTTHGLTWPPPDEADSPEFDPILQLWAIERGVEDIHIQLLRQFPRTTSYYPHDSPGALHHFQLVTLLLYELQAHLEWNFEIPNPMTPEEEELFQEENLIHDKNNLARAMNSNITVTTMALEPLYATNGEPIPNFPKTGADIRKLKGRAINKLLLALDLPTDGKLSDRKERFMKYIGFTMLLAY